MEKYRGDTFIFQLSIKEPDGSNYIFQDGDIVKCGMKKFIGDKKYILESEKKLEDLEEDTQEVTFEFGRDETLKINEGDYVLEFTLVINGIVNTVYQKPIKIRGIVNE